MPIKLLMIAIALVNVGSALVQFGFHTSGHDLVGALNIVASCSIAYVLGKRWDTL